MQDDNRSASRATLPESRRPVVRCAEGTNFNSPLQLDFPDQLGEPDKSEPTWFREIGSPVRVEPITECDFSRSPLIKALHKPWETNSIISMR
ncbi:hypothetical protein FGI60_17325 [Brucella haematophila]|nr:hypothetical protein F9K79_07450 [Ochrobactrum sp. Kaboul]TMU96323.1 hypothetical protein FGI60_17325 [Brucella haematophila]